MVIFIVCMQLRPTIKLTNEWEGCCEDEIHAIAVHGKRDHKVHG